GSTLRRQGGEAAFVEPAQASALGANPETSRGPPLQHTDMGAKHLVLMGDQRELLPIPAGEAFLSADPERAVLILVDRMPQGKPQRRLALLGQPGERALPPADEALARDEPEAAIAPLGAPED